MANNIKKYWLIYLFFIGLVTVILVTYKDYGIVWDEAYYFNIGKYLVNKLFKLFGMSTNLDYSYLFSVTQTTKTIDLQLETHGVIFDVVVVLISLLFQSFSFAHLHLIKALLSLTTFIMTAKISYRLFGSKTMALISMILLLLFPRFYGEIFNNSIDVGTTLFVSLLIYYFLYYLAHKSNFVNQTIFGILLAILLNQRILLAYIFALVIILIGFNNFIRKISFVRSVKEIFIIGLVTFIFLHLTNPYLLAHPFTGLIDIINSSKHFNYAASVLFESQFIMANQLPWYYLPKVMTITIPPMTIGLFILGMVRLLHSLFNRKYKIENKIINLFFLLLFFLPFILVFAMRPTLYDNWRHFLFLTIPIIIIASFGFEAIMNIRIKVVKCSLYFIIMVGFFLTAKEMFLLHPYQYIYYNSFVGGIKGANEKYEMEYGGAAYKEAVEWFNKNINNNKDHYKVFVMSDPISGTYFFKKNMIFTNNFYLADYYISSTRWRSQNLADGDIIHIVQREGVPLIYIKKLRN